MGKSKNFTVTTEPNDDHTVTSSKSALASSTVLTVPKPSRQQLLKYYQSKPWINRARTIVKAGFLLSTVGLVLATVLLILITPRCRKPKHWIKAPVVYDLYVRSFSDSDGDGMGDIKGVSEKLDYIKSLGVKTILLDSIFEYDLTSPFGQTMGLTATNWTQVSKEIGSLHDLSGLVKSAAGKGLQIYLTFIPNHVYKSHPWFLASVTREDRYENYFVWAPCTSTEMPNNWKNLYDGGSAWSYEPTRKECFLHQFASQMPDLNLRSKLVSDEIESALRFWMSVGVSGFYIPRVSHLHVDYDLRDLNVTRRTNLRESRDVIRRWGDVITADGKERNLIVRLDHVTPRVVTEFLSEVRASHVFVVSDQLRDCDSRCLRGLVQNNYQTRRTVFQLSSSMTSRVAEAVTAERSKVMHLLMLTMAAGASLYYGDEIGMKDSTEDPKIVLKGMTYSQYRSITPLPWSNQTWNNSWIPVSDTQTTVQESLETKDSTLSLVTSLLRLRNDAAFQYGMTHSVQVCPTCVAFVRQWDGTERYLIIGNLGNTTSPLHVTNNLVPETADVVVSTSSVYRMGKSVTLNRIRLPANQGLVVMWPYER